jgi:uncharacterized membrane protein
MIAYHLCFDFNLPWVRVLDADFNRSAFWLSFRGLIVTSFMALVGVSLHLAREGRISPVRYWRRIGVIVLCAALVSAGSYLMFPQTFISFGILHCIALCSLLAWPLVSRPRAAAIVGIALIALGNSVHDAFFDARPLQWIGLMTHKPATEDYVPLLPWLGVVLIGIAAGAWLSSRHFSPLAPLSAAPGWVQWLGRHSLLVYMAHQPLLLAVLWLLFGR